jgi:type I restriction enzyme S subunit
MPKFKEQARVLASGLKVYGLSKTSISKISIEIPPLKEQEAIAEALSVMDDELEALTEQVSKLRMVKEGMTHDLLTGKVRLA